jgi:hypothetical protein
METIDISYNTIKGGISVLQSPKPMTPEDLAKLPIVVNGTFTIKK